MVKNGKTNEEIYAYIARNYGEYQIAVPRHGWTRRLSYGLPFLLVGMLMVVALGFAWNWTGEDESPDDGDRSGEEKDKRERIKQLVSEEGPLR